MNGSNNIKTLFWDVETSLMSALTFTLWPERITHDNILVDTHLLCACWKWAHEEEVHSVSIHDHKTRFKADHHDDFHVVNVMHKVLQEADEIVHHHGDSFDIKVLNRGLIKHGLEPLPEAKFIDTKKICSRKFKFTSNKLDAVGEYLGVGNKIHTDMALWRACFHGDIEALEKMVTYCKQDVLLLEAVYKKLKPFQPSSMGVNRNLLAANAVCPKCGSDHLMSRGYAITKVSKYQRFQCQECGSWSQARAASKSTNVEVK